MKIVARLVCFGVLISLIFHSCNSSDKKKDKAGEIATGMLFEKQDKLAGIPLASTPFGGGELPAEIPTAILKLSLLLAQFPQCQPDLDLGRLAAPQLLKAAGLFNSTSDAMRLIAQGGFSVIEAGQTRVVSNTKETLSLDSGTVLRAGKKKIVRLEIVRD